MRERFPQQISRQSHYTSSRSLSGFNLSGLAVSCPRHNKAHQETRSNHQSTYADAAYANTCTCTRACTRGSTEPKLKGRKATEQKEGSSREPCGHFILCLLCSATRHKVQIKAGTGDYPGSGGGGERRLRWSGCFPAGDSATSTSSAAPSSEIICQFHLTGKESRNSVTNLAEKGNNVALRQDRKQETGRQQQQRTDFEKKTFHLPDRK